MCHRPAPIHLLVRPGGRHVLGAEQGAHTPHMLRWLHSVRLLHLARMGCSPPCN